MSGRGCISRSEWAWALAWGMAALLVTSLPYALGAALSTPEARFGGGVYGVEDVNSYLAKMRQGAEGAWLFQIPYTAEPHPATIIYLYYLLLGKGGAALGLSLELTFHLARIVGGALLLAAIYDWLSHYVSLPVRRLGYLLAAFSGGLGWLLALLGRSEWLGWLPLDLISPEAYPFLTLYSMPHLALATAALLWGMPRLGEGAERHDLGPVLAGSAAYLVVALIGAFYLVGPYAVLGICWLIAALRQRRPDWRHLGLLVLSALPAAAVLLYDLAYFTFDPVYSIWAAQNLLPSLPAPHYVAGYLVQGTLALLGGGWALHKRRRDLWLPAVWVGLAPALLCLPFTGQRRLIIGAPVALSLFAALGAVYVLALPFGRSRLVRWLRRWPRYSRRGMRRLLLAGVVALTAPTNVLLVVGNSLEVLERAPPIYHTREEDQALDWLRAHSTPHDVVLCAYETGNYVPARARVRVVLGLGTETIHAARKRAEVRRFFDAAETDAWRRELLARYRVSYVIVGPAERALGSYDASQAPYLAAVYDNGAYAVYAVRGKL
ncbi:MAG: hypothetical protein JXA09_00055 [Anaerolineae bacterium]|nr:hypothetical protein [Anaerolineae bacterium]